MIPLKYVYYVSIQAVSIGQFLLHLKETSDISILLVEQNFDLLQTVSDRAYAMEKGIVSDDLSADDINNDDILATYIAV